MAGQTDSQVGPQVHTSRKFHAYTVDLQSSCADQFKLDQSQRKSTQVGGQTKRKFNASRKFPLTCIESVWVLRLNCHYFQKPNLSNC